MPKATDESAMSRIGVSFVDGVCARAHQVWRETPHTDVGLDGQIELVEDGLATGLFLGVQVKTGLSYLSADGQVFMLKADQNHFAYWAACAVPVIGVVVDPVRHVAMWINLTAECSLERIQHGPHTVAIPFGDDNAFTITALEGRIKDLAANYSNQRVTRWQLRSLEQDLVREEANQRPSGETEQRLVWNMLCADIGSPRFSAEETVRVVMRLSWHFPTVADELKEHLRQTLGNLDESYLARVVSAVGVANDSDRPDIAELIADVLAETPNASKRVLTLLAAAILPRADREAAIQVLEMCDEGPRTDLRREYLP